MEKNKLISKAGIVSLILSFGVKVGALAADDPLNVPSLAAASIGVEIAAVNADGTLQTLYARDAGRALMPASTLKLLSTATALTLCGASTTVQTTVGICGAIDTDGTLRGDVVIRGGGDATLASTYDVRKPETFVTASVNALKAAGVQRVEGRIIGDGSLLPDDGVAPDWTWEDMGNYYAAGLCGLNYGANMYQLVLDTSVPGTQPQVLRTQPEVPGLTFDNRLSRENYPFDSAYIYGAPHSNLRRLEGAVPHHDRTFTIKGDLPDPALMAAAALQRALTNAGVTVSGTAESDYTLRQAGLSVPVCGRTCYTHRSAPLSDVARWTNVYSQNLLAEMMLRMVVLNAKAGESTSATVGKQTGEATQYSSVAARGRLLNYWRQQGLDVTGVRMYDGCGLSPNNRVTAHFLAQLLAHMRGNEAFVASLPLVGREGTVRNFATGTRLSGKARLKSGTTKQVVAYAGYITGSDGRTYVAVAIVNNFDGRAAAVRRLVADLLVKYVN